MNDFLKRFFGDDNEKDDQDCNIDSQGTYIFHDKADSEPEPEPIQTDLSPFKEINANIYAFSIKIYSGPKFHVAIFGKDNDKVTVRVDDDRLIIHEPKQSRNIYYRSQPSKPPLISVTIPTDTQLSRVKIKAFAGSTVLNNLTIQSLQVKLLAGSAKLTEITVKYHAKVELSAGSLNIKHCDLNLYAELAAGSAKIKYCKLNGDNRISLSAGSLRMTEDDPTKLSYQLKTSFGSIFYHGEKKGNSFHHQATGENRLNVKSSVGSIKIN